MPVVDYSKILIYKIVCKDLNVTECYVAHTTNFSKRKNQHKDYSTNNRTYSYLKVYEMIRANGGWTNWEMIEIEKYPCNDFNEARARERYWYEILNSKLNSRKPIIYVEEQRLYDRERAIVYYHENQYYENNKEEIKNRVKCYADNNKDLIASRGKEYRAKNHEVIQQKKSEQILCECGLYATSCHFQRHRRTKLHQQRMEEKTNTEENRESVANL
jgi:hypothetical protein